MCIISIVFIFKFFVKQREELMRRICILIGVLLCIGLTACDSAKEGPASEYAGIKCDPVDYKNGVLYFPCIEATFASALSRYKSEHSELRVTAMAGNGTDSNGYDRGYFVSTEPR